MVITVTVVVMVITVTVVVMVIGPNPTFVSLGAIRHKNRQMKELSDDLFHT
jgi:hypothetical protein